jgi:peroxiredoxin Q/BCP
MQAATTSIQIGSRAPEFTSLLTTGNVVNLKDYKGKKVVLYFYPKDDTPGCTVEACGLRDQYQKIRELGAEILGVSIDNVASHQHFTRKFNLPFQLVADSDKSITKAYDVLNEKSGMARRVTFIVDEKGFIERVFDPVKADAHTQQVIDALSH